MLAWMNTFPEIPVSIARIDYEFMDPEAVCMALSLIQGPYVLEEFISGKYVVDYQFKVIYRVRPSSPDGRLKADELLDKLGAWMEDQTPDIGAGLEVQELEQATQAALFARMENGWEDHQIFMRMTYLVHPGK